MKFAATIAAVGLMASTAFADPDYDAIRVAIAKALDDPRHDDGSLGPILLRLAWHSAGTFDADGFPVGGANGATMRFEPERSYEENRGLELARDTLEPIKQEFPEISYSDLWVLASYTAVQEMEGPKIDFVGGRVDAASGGELCPPEERLPEFDETNSTMRAKFARMGLGDREIVALMGAHTVGRTHDESSGFPYASWDNTPVKFDNTYYDFLITQFWQEDEVDGKVYYRNRSWIMLLSDFLMKEDPNFLPFVELYRQDQDAWFRDFSAAFKKITELGLPTQE